MFIDDVFPVEASYGTGAGKDFKTTIYVGSSGIEKRNINWSVARGSWSVVLDTLDEDEQAEVIGFFESAHGAGHGFRLRSTHDWSSARTGTKAPEMSAKGAQLLGMGTGTRKTFQLIKTSGSKLLPYVRTISRPLPGTVNVYTGTAQAPVALASGYTVNYGDADNAGGLITFNTAPSTGTHIWASFEFDYPVRFADDKLILSIDDYGKFSGSVNLVEIKEA